MHKTAHLIIAMIVISSIAACSAKNVKNTVEPNNIIERKTIEQNRVEIEPALQVCHYPAYCFEIALKDYNNSNTAEAVKGFLSIAGGFPDSIWKERSLFMIGKIYKEASDPRAVDYLNASAQGYKELQDYALYFLAEYYFSKGYYSYAIENYNAVIKSYPYSPLISRAIYKKAEAYLAGGYYLQSKEGFNEFIRRFPENGQVASAIYKIGEAFEKEGNDVNAADYYKRILYEFPSNPLSKTSGERFSELKEKNPQISDLTVDELLLRANNLYKYPLFDKAAAEYQRLLETLPEERHGEILQKLGVSLFKLGKTEDAIQVFNRIVSRPLSKNSAAEAILWLGKCYVRLGDNDNMLKSYQTIIKRYSESEWADDAIFAIAEDYSSKGDFKNAIHYYKKLTEEFPENYLSEQAFWYRGWLNYKLGNYKEASTAFDGFLIKYPLSDYVNRVLYWKGRAAERRGQIDSAAEMYRKTCRSQYNFYCYNARLRDSSLLNISLPINNNLKVRDGFEIGSANNIIEADYNLVRAKELSVLGMNQDAINELNKLKERTSLNKEGLLMVNKMLYELGEYHMTVKSIIQNFYDKIERGGNDMPDYFWGLAYPQGYWAIVTEYAARYNLDPYLVASIMREESWFDKQAVSRSGARGVMQLMPFTARWVSKQLKYSYTDDESLFEADININFGTWYLSYLKKRLNGNIVLMIAGYNAGPEAVIRWINANGGMDVDEFIESIPYNETKSYVKRVLRSYAEYHRIYNNNAIKWESLN
ncbi:MAG: tetratricopeptide repeat protein [Nitrospirae bacterium]|nr:tetratricopeptide repeat protein [Nitrospirota bacterium]